MDVLQIALVILVSVWTIIFIIMGIAMYFIYRSVRRAMDKVNRFLDTTEEMAESARLPSKVIMGAVMGFLAKNSANMLKNMIASKFGKKNK